MHQVRQRNRGVPQAPCLEMLGVPAPLLREVRQEEGRAHLQDNGYADCARPTPHPLEQDSAILAYFHYVKHRSQGHTLKQTTLDIALESASRLLSIAGIPVEEGRLHKLLRDISTDSATHTRIRDILVSCATAKNAPLAKYNLFSLQGIFRANNCPLSFEADQHVSVYRKRHGHGIRPETYTVSQDKALVRYFTNIKARKRNNGFISKATIHQATAAARHFLDHLNTQVTDHAIGDIITRSRQDAAFKEELEDSLLTFSNLEPIPSHRKNATFLKGIFKANRCPLNVSIDNHFNAKTPKISEGILQAIYKSLDNEHQTLIDLQAFSGERVQCICTISTSQIKTFNDEYAIIEVKPFQTKARIEHPSIIPKSLADRVLKIAKQTGRETPFPNHKSLWRDITKLALDKFNVRLTSHYLRKRFFSIAEKTPMPTNHWDLLMGSQKQTGHCAENYSLEDYSELVEEYDRYLASLLDLSKTSPEVELAKPTELDKLLRENAELKDQLLKLTQLLTQKLITP